MPQPPNGQATIWHNPACGTSRNTLALLQQAGLELRVVEYLKTPPSRAELVRMIAAAGLSLRAALRETGELTAELGLADLGLSDDALLDAMCAHPILINRPFVETARGARLCRPSELVRELLPYPAQPDPL
ncbi:MAG: arsenate reductase (glutaredoxin) [Sandaracinobacteroides sp.]